MGLNVVIHWEVQDQLNGELSAALDYLAKRADRLKAAKEHLNNCSLCRLNCYPAG